MKHIATIPYICKMHLEIENDLRKLRDAIRCVTIDNIDIHFNRHIFEMEWENTVFKLGTVADRIISILLRAQEVSLSKIFFLLRQYLIRNENMFNEIIMKIFVSLMVFDVIYAYQRNPWWNIENSQRQG